MVGLTSLFLAYLGLELSNFLNISKNYVGASYEPAGAALRHRFETTETRSLAKFHVYRFKDGGYVKFQKLNF